MNKFFSKIISIFLFSFFTFTTQVVEASNQGHLTYSSKEECEDKGTADERYHPVVAQQTRPAGAVQRPLLKNACPVVTVAAAEVGDVADLRKNDPGIQRYVFLPKGGRVWDVNGQLFMDGCFNTIFEIAILESSEKTAQTAPAPQSPVQRTEHYERHDHVYRDQRSSDLASLNVQQRWTSDNTDTLIVEVNKTARTYIRWTNGRKIVQSLSNAYTDGRRLRGPRQPNISICSGNNNCNTDVIALLQVQGPPVPQGPPGRDGTTTIITTPTPTPTTPVATLPPRDRPSEPVPTRPRPSEPNSGGNTGTTVSGPGPRTNPGPVNTGGTVITPLVPRPRPSDPSGG